MYPPPYHQEDNFDNVIRTIQAFPLATLISVYEAEASITHLPLIYVEDGSSYGKLLGHMDKNNPQCKLLEDKKIQVIFHGPDGYISPNRYSTDQLPTWNYIKVHIDGFSRVMKSADLVKQSMVTMADRFETGENRFVLDIDDPRMARLINYVVAFEVEIQQWEGKFKLSQDKIKKDMAGAKKALIESSQAKAGYFIGEIFENHRQKEAKS